MSTAKLKITLTRSTIGREGSQVRTVQALGLRRMQHSVVHTDTPQIRGMIRKIGHLVVVEEVQEG